MQHTTDKELKILYFFYKHKSGHVRKINKEIRLSAHTLLKYLKELEKKRIIFSKKQGNLKIFTINPKNPLIKIFFSYFDILRLNKIEIQRKRAIKEFLKKIKQIKLPYFILLFGSTAKGDYTKTSDIDLIEIYDSYNRSIKEKINFLAKDIRAETGIKINYILMGLREFIKEKNNQKNYALQDALQTGYPILGNDLFYELIL